MVNKDDWDRCRERFDAFWEGEVLDRCCIAAPKSKPAVERVNRREPRDLRERWLDPDYRLDEFLYWTSLRLHAIQRRRRAIWSRW